ncbi:MAG: ABC transporter permease [Coriobacteriales bacterium]|jgi:D-methionine transport system permease protein|nr:ABC transporter permease [Coriobacteriales bacterium]
MQTIETLLPNVVKYWDVFLQAIIDTLIMVSVTLALVIIFGTLIGIILAVISKGHLYQNAILNAIIPKIVNLFRAIPFVILLALLLPFTRLIVGTAIGVPGAIVPMVIAMTPFVSRQIELTLLEVDMGVIQMARSMGFSKPYIVLRIMLSEARAGIIRSFVISSISIVSFATMAGVIGGGGIGDFAIRYGYGRMMTDITFVSVIVLLVLVFSMQGIGNFILRKTTH